MRADPIKRSNTMQGGVMRIHRLFAISAVLLFGVFLAGCGGSSSSNNDPPTNNDPPANNDPPGGDTGGDNASVTSASACFNRNLFVSGAKYETVTRTTDADGLVLQTTSQVNTDGAAIFPPTGETLTKVIANVSSSVFGLATFEFFLDVDPAVPEIRTYGISAGDETVVNDPYQLQRFNLEPGDSYEQTYSQDEILPDTGNMITKKTTYTGRETITVPAGTFETCRFDETITDSIVLGSITTDIVSSGTEWFGVGNGLLIKGKGEVVEPIAGGEEIIVLLSASINNVPVSP
jgi:hypothetical protein